MLAGFRSMLLSVVLACSVSGDSGPTCSYKGVSGSCVTVDAKGQNLPDCRDKGGFFITNLCEQGVHPSSRDQLNCAVRMLSHDSLLSPG
jgi:hypothetical protein